MILDKRGGWDQMEILTVEITINYFPAKQNDTYHFKKSIIWRHYKNRVLKV